MFLSWQNIFFIRCLNMYFMLPQYVFLFSQCMFVTSLLHVVSACFLLLCCMFLSSFLHVILVVSTRYFSRIYHYIIFFIHGFPLHPCFHMFHPYAITACMAVFPLHFPWIHPSNRHSLLPCLLSSFILFCLLHMIVFILCNGPSYRMC